MGLGFGYPNSQPLAFSAETCFNIGILKEHPMETPNSPAELFAMQAVPEVDTNDCDAFADYLVDEILPDLEPSPYQTVKAVERLLGRLKAYHFEMLHDEEIEMDAWVKLMWEEDFKRLSAALDAVRLVNPD